MPQRRKPTKLKLIEGNPGKKKIKPEQEFGPYERCPTPPAELNDSAARFWRGVGPELVAKGLLGRANRFTFEALCLAYARMYDADKPAGADRASAVFIRLSQEFGLSPKSVQAISLPEPEEKTLLERAEGK